MDVSEPRSKCLYLEPHGRATPGHGTLQTRTEYIDMSTYSYSMIMIISMSDEYSYSYL